MAASRVTAIQNMGDGLLARVTLDAAPSGAVTAKASRLPGNPSAGAVTVTPISSTVYEVAVRNGMTQRELRSRLPYYVQVFDGATQLASYQIDRTQKVAEETCVLLSIGTEQDWMDQCEQAFLEILLDNYQAINRSAEAYLGSSTLPSGAKALLQKLHPGVMETDGKYPAASINTNSLRDDPYWANPRVDYMPFDTEIVVYACHQTAENWVPYCRAHGMGIFTVLNQDHYLEIPLACGLTMFECYATLGTSRFYLDEAAEEWVSSFTLTVQSKLFVGRERI